MLQDYKEAFIEESAQFIVTTSDGLVKGSDNSLFKLRKGEKIEEVHPFFYNLINLVKESSSRELSFGAVHLTFAEAIYIADVNLRYFKENDEIIIIIQDFSSIYNQYQKMIQKKNESVLQRELLLQKNLRLKERENIINLFISKFSHELKDPINSIIAFSELLDKTSLEEEQQAYTKSIKSFGNRLFVLLDEILKINKKELDEMDINESYFNIHELFLGIKERYRQKSDAINLKFNYEIDSEIPNTLIGDELSISQAITSVLDNILADSNSGQVQLSVKLHKKIADKTSLQFIVKYIGDNTTSNITKSKINGSEFVSNNTNILNIDHNQSIENKVLELLNSELEVDTKTGEASVYSFNLKLKHPVSL